MRAFAKLVGWLIVILSLLGGVVMCSEGASAYDGGMLGAIGFASALGGTVFGLILLMLASIDARLEALKINSEATQSDEHLAPVGKNAETRRSDGSDPDADSKAEFNRQHGTD